MATSLGITRIPLRVRDLILIVSALGATILIAWGYLFTLSEKMSLMDVSSMKATAMVGLHTWHGGDFLGMFAMWAVMMVAIGCAFIRTGFRFERSLLNAHTKTQA